ncbi:MAG: PD-(D/E)XK nuclease family protein [Patescibacteria group bacterium]|nr:PD-(D/E)XK nuclease family protein [Patescibacteria group bacterium]
MTEKQQPNPFCETLPTQLRAWDATSLRAYMECPRRYQLSIVEGWRREGLHTQWGSLYHGAVEEYDKARCAGMNKEDALDVAFQWALENSGYYVEFDAVGDDAGPYIVKEWEPWGSAYLPFWVCTDPGPIAKSGPRKGQPMPERRCVMAKSLQEGHRPRTCPLCGAETVEKWQWVHADPAKNRQTLLRALVWYVEEQAEEGGVQPYKFPDGKPAVELSFQVPLPLTSPDGTPYILCGHIDSLTTFGEEVGIRERKTTKASISNYYFDRYSPDVQIDTYDLVGSVLFPDLLSRWVMLEATQTAEGFARFHRHFISSTEGRRDEFLRDTLYWITKAEADARSGYYPKNEASCYSHGGCPFREICTKDPASRERWLEAEFIKKHWNPIAER